MKRSHLFTSLLLGAMLATAALCTPNVTGKWSGTMQMGGDANSQPAYVVLKQDGNKLTGSAGPTESEQHPFEGGKVEGNKVMFDVSLGGGPGAMHFDLQVDGDQITGQVRRSGDGRNEAAKISLKRVAERQE